MERTTVAMDSYGVSSMTLFTSANSFKRRLISNAMPYFPFRIFACTALGVTASVSAMGSNIISSSKEYT